MKNAKPGTILIASLVASAIALSGCAGPGGSGGSTAASAASTSGTVASEATAANVARVGLLSNYLRLQPMPGGGGMLCWRDSGVNWKQYTKVMLDPIDVAFHKDWNPERPGSRDPSLSR